METSLAIKLLALFVAVGLVGGGAFFIFYEPDDDDDDDDVPDDGIFRYVSLGASNTNGYGMKGYVSEEDVAKFLNGEVNKNEINSYGYQKVPEGSYPDLIRDHYVQKVGQDKFSMDQLAISSMRVEELRVLLDNSYDGDDYTSWRFTGAEGWFKSAEPGGLSALRTVYQNSISEADLITVDIGWNNFGVYVSNQLIEYINTGDYFWTTDLSDIFDTPAEIEDAEDAKAIIGGYIQTNMGNSQISTVLTDIFAYGILGYMHNFDVVMDRIYTLNPDADVVVIGIQNLLHGVVVEIGGNEFPLGDLYGNFVDMANYYASSCSPHNDDYLYVKAGTDEHVSVFLDQMRSYDDVEDLNPNVIDCYNFYDDNLFIQMTLDKEFANFIDNDPMYSFIFGLMGVKSGEEFITNGKAEQLGNIQSLFDDLYWPALDAAYDTLSVVVKEVATMGPVKADLLLNGLDISAEEDKLKGAIEDEIMENVMSIVEGVINESVEDYVVDIDKVMPDDEARIVTAMYVRFFMGNSFFLHPDETGHSQIMTAVIGVIDAPNTEKAETLSNELKDSVEDIAQLIAA